MAWVRLDDSVMDHPKVLALSDGAFRLWIAGLAYCQKHLTDGALSRVALRGLRGVTRTRVGELSAPQVAGRPPLWKADGDGFRVHDYLQWNDARDVVLRRQNDARDRRDRYDRVRRVPNGEIDASAPIRFSLGSEDLGEGEDGETPDDPRLDGRAAAFLHRYEAMYPRFRKGARYFCTRRAIDFSVARQLVATFADDAWLDKMVELFLRTDHDFAASGSRTVGQFAALASWCDGRLREHGMKPAGEAVTAS